MRISDWSSDVCSSDLERINAARHISFHPLSMKAVTVSGKTVNSPAINEVSLLRETRQTAKIEVSVDGRIRMAELVCDGVLVATPPGSTAYNLSARSEERRVGQECVCQCRVRWGRL